MENVSIKDELEKRLKPSSYVSQINLIAVEKVCDLAT